MNWRMNEWSRNMWTSVLEIFRERAVHHQVILELHAQREWFRWRGVLGISMACPCLQCIRSFLWLACHDCLMGNLKRFKCDMSSDPMLHKNGYRYDYGHKTGTRKHHLENRGYRYVKENTKKRYKFLHISDWTPR